MTQNEKDLLIKDLCGRLSHGVKCEILEINEVKILGAIQYDGENTLFDFWKDDQKIKYEYQLYLSEFRPCLLPLSSMTEKQKEEYDYECNKDLKTLSHSVANRTYNKIRIATPLYYGIDWLNKNHFDYRGLIPMGLAIDATGLNIY